MNKAFPIRTFPHSFGAGAFEVLLETGLVAQNTDAAVTVQVGDTVLLATVALGKTLDEVPHFLPLSVHYQERAYAGGKIPGSFFRREGRPSETEVLISRLIDRCLRPLCPKHFATEIQLVVTVLSADPQIHPDIPALLGASAALSLSSVPFDGPVAACRLGFAQDQWCLNPTMEVRAQSSLDLVVATNRQGLVMLEGAAQEYGEGQIVEAIAQAQKLNASVIEEIERFVAQAQSAGRVRTPLGLNEVVERPLDRKALEEHFEDLLKGSLEFAQSLQRLERAEAYVKAHWRDWQGGAQGHLFQDQAQVFTLLKGWARKMMRKRLFEEQRRLDGRSPQTIRALDIRRRVLPRAHGSALFTRGGTQALAVVTLGSDKEARMMEDLVGSKSENFLMHYNFLPFCVGSTGLLGSPKRREVGHGALAKRAFLALLPSSESFPNCLRVVSEILEADGSSSMATVCAASIAMMDGGVPLPRHVAGVAMGLLLEGDQGMVLSDISECEDHLGDMDLKVAGTERGITALQMDIKLPGIPLQWLAQALQQAQAARMHLLQAMQQVIDESAPLKGTLHIHQMQIPPHKIRDLIGKGGAVIKKISESFQARIDVADSGCVKFSLAEEQDPERLKSHIMALLSDPETGVALEGLVTRKENFGLFVKLRNSQKTGLLHVSELQKGGVGRALPQIGDHLWVRVLAIDAKTGKLKLTLHEELTLSASNEEEQTKSSISEAETAPAAPAA